MTKSHKRRPPLAHLTTTPSMAQRLHRQAPFLKSLLQEAKAKQRNSLLRAANADQINAVSELVLNVIKGVAPRTSNTVRVLRPKRRALRDLTKRRQSIKRRRRILMSQSGGALWSELNRCYKRCCRQLKG